MQQLNLKRRLHAEIDERGHHIQRKKADSSAPCEGYPGGEMIPGFRTLRQVCHTQAANEGGTWPFLWQLPLLWARVAARQWPKRDRFLNQNTKPASYRWGWAGRRRKEGPRVSLRPLCRWTARLPTARLPFCRRGEENLVSVERGCGVSCDREGARRSPGQTRSFSLLGL